MVASDGRVLGALIVCAPDERARRSVRLAHQSRVLPSVAVEWAQPLCSASLGDCARENHCGHRSPGLFGSMISLDPGAACRALVDLVPAQRSAKVSKFHNMGTIAGAGVAAPYTRLRKQGLATSFGQELRLAEVVPMHCVHSDEAIRRSCWPSGVGISSGRADDARLISGASG